MPHHEAKIRTSVDSSRTIQLASREYELLIEFQNNNILFPVFNQSPILIVCGIAVHYYQSTNIGMYVQP